MKPIAFARGGGRLGCALFGTGRAPPAQRTLRMSFLNMQSASKNLAFAKPRGLS
jgi:hypothetical protein